MKRHYIIPDHYDIQIRAEGEGGPLTTAELRHLVRLLLVDRFQLKVHTETREVPAYGLVVGKDGPKMKQAAPDAPKGGFVRGGEKGMHMEVTRGTMEQLASQLSGAPGRPVIDKTGLTGYYAYTLDWFPANRIAPPELDTPSMFDAVREQLGLRLESTKTNMETLVIDHAEKPSEN